MKTLVLEEAAARLSDICEEVVRTESAIVLSREGEPFVLITPCPAVIRAIPTSDSVWRAVAELERNHSQSAEDGLAVEELVSHWDTDRDALSV